MEREKVEALLAGLLARQPKASELNFTPGRLPHLEVDGELVVVPLGSRTEPLTAAEVERLAMAIMGDSAPLRAALCDAGAADLSYALADGRRFRANVFRVKGQVAVVLRTLASEIPALERLGAPAILEQVAALHNGLALVTGATGSGKSTTLAAVIDRINSTRAVHVITLEDPVEFAHPPKKAIVNQRELQLDFPTFAHGLRAALRQAPKVILVGEMRDRETVDIALKAAETGHLVLSTLHTIDAGQTINRIVGMFPTEERQLVRNRLAETLRFVVGQRLLPRIGGGRVAAFEVMGSSLRVRELIVEDESGDRTYRRAIEDSRSRGWQSFDQHITELFAAGQITGETALAYASDSSVVRRAIDQVKASRGEATSDLGELQMATVRPRR